ncbi:hypothetical protein A8B78_07435 [Jannaschia sp. EhC01]|nr:hypothetical protein A8B78_07435 [Jannaschia sp. EhC01]
MIARLRAAWRKAPWLMSAFAVALALTLYFGTRMTMSAIYWADPRHIDQDIAGWMSPGYVAMSWDVPREVMIAAIGQDPSPGRPHRLEDIASARGVPLATLIEQIEAEIQSFRNAQP